MVVHGSFVDGANDALLSGDFVRAVTCYAQAIASKMDITSELAFNLTVARRRWRRSRRDAPLRVGICGWEMAHNAAGRVRTLADITRGVAETEIIGATFPPWGDTLWPPLRDMDLACHLIHVADEAAFPAQALALVCAHPFDTVILSKPRFPNIVFGLLYKLIWDARVIVDIDDEELGVVRADAPMALEALLEKNGGTPRWQDLGQQDWTRAAVALWDIFDASTVSNLALQARYAGTVIPHARDAEQLRNSPARRQASRRHFGIPEDRSVVLFFGTPRRHKGILETAQAVAALGRDDLCLVVAGDFKDLKLRADLEAIPGIDIRFLPGQPYNTIADVVALGDICVLLQDDTGLLGSYQMPAKLVDALAMELLVLAQPTPALMELAEGGAIVPVSPDTLRGTLACWLDDPDRSAQVRRQGREFFERYLSVQAVQPQLARLLPVSGPATLPGQGFSEPRQQALFDALGGWQMFSPPSPPVDTPPDTLAPHDAPRPAALSHGEAAAEPVAEPVAEAPAVLPTPGKVAKKTGQDPVPAPAAAPVAPGPRIIVYSVLVGDYETLKEPAACDPAARYILFTDDPGRKSDRWEVMPFDTQGLSPRRASRLPKLLPHRYLPDHDVSVYLDASLAIIEPDVSGMVREALQDSDFAAYPHFRRGCIQDEIAECLKLGKTTAPEAASVQKILEDAAFPRNLGLVENAFLVRRNTEVIRELNEAWHALFSQHAGRDQFYLMYLAWQRGIPIRRIANAPEFRKSPHVRFTKHDWTRTPKVSLQRQIRWTRPARQGAVRSINWKRESTS